MSKMVYNDIATGDLRAAETVNTILSDLNTASGALDDTNLAEEGLDVRNVSARALSEIDTTTPRTGFVADETVTTGVNGAYALLTLGAVPIELDWTGVELTLGADEVLEIEGQVSAEDNGAGTPGIPAGNVLFATIFVDVGFGYVEFVGAESQEGPGASASLMPGGLLLSALFPIRKIAVFVKIVGGGTWRIGSAGLYACVHRRV
jgi:hypothetical protein